AETNAPPKITMQAHAISARLDTGYRFVTTSSSRRFCARPASLLLSAVGRSCPYPCASIRSAATPPVTSICLTVSARCSDSVLLAVASPVALEGHTDATGDATANKTRSEEHTSELQSLTNLVCRLLLEKTKKHHHHTEHRRT